MKTITLALAILAAFSLVGCGGTNPPPTTYDPSTDYQDVQFWDRHLENETNRTNQTFDNLNNSSRALGLPTLDD